MEQISDVMDSHYISNTFDESYLVNAEVILKMVQL